MGRQAAVALYVLALIAVVVGVDVLFFRHQFWERPIVNVGIVLVFGAFYLRFLKDGDRPGAWQQLLHPAGLRPGHCHRLAARDGQVRHRRRLDHRPQLQRARGTRVILL